MVSVVDSALGKLAAVTGAELSKAGRGPLSERVAEALGWKAGPGRAETLAAEGSEGLISITRGLLGPQPVAVFVADGAGGRSRLLRDAARFAYHSSVHWGAAADEAGIVVFNSHWIRNEDWFHLPEIHWAGVEEHLGLLGSMTPKGVAEGRLDKVAADVYEPDRFLTPVDDALVARLDRWRVEALRHGRDAEGLDADLHTLFAQLFVLRAVEDRRLESTIPSLEKVLRSPEHLDQNLLRALFQRAREVIQSQLFAEEHLDQFPEFVVAGIIQDLYESRELPKGSSRYNFAWIDADVLGHAYEKYLANLYAPAPLKAQLRLFDQPRREVSEISVKKSGGKYYTPSYLFGTLTDQAIDHTLAEHEDPEFVPRVADFACGSGSFLVESVGALVRRLRKRDPQRNWARILIEDKRIVGVDIDPRAVTLSRLNLWIRLTGEPNPLPLPSIDEVVVCGDSLGDDVWSHLPDTYDVVVGNPPFVATSSIRSREELADRFKTAEGRFDYAHLFIELAIRRLAPEGVLGMVVPNRLFRNRDAGLAREMLTTETELLSVIDFGGNEVFEGTSGYIGTVMARKRVDAESAPHRKVRAVVVSDTSDTRYLGGLLADALNSTGEFRHDVVKGFDIDHPVGRGPWVLLPPEARVARVHLEQGGVPLAELAGIYQGIRTGANDIFIVQVESTDGNLARVVNGTGAPGVVEAALLRPVAYGSDIRRYDLVRPTQRLVYPYVKGVPLSESEIRDRFPRAYGYLLSYQHLLGSRNSIISGGLRWYELVRRRDEYWLTTPKLCDLPGTLSQG